MVADYTYQQGVVITPESTLVTGGDGILKDQAGGSTQQLYDLQGNPIVSVSVNALGVHAPFRADVPRGVLTFGLVDIPVVSLEAADGAEAMVVASAAAAEAEQSRVALQEYIDAHPGGDVEDIFANALFTSLLELAVDEQTAGLSDVYASAPAVEPYLGNSAAAEQAQVTALLPASISADTTVAIGACLYQAQVDQLVFGFTGSVAESNSNYWTVTLLRYRGGSIATLAAKTTKVPTDTGGGEGITAWSGWNFDMIDLSVARVRKDDILAVRFIPTGAPAALAGGVLGYRLLPTDGSEPPLPTPGAVVVSDAFTRADGSSLGSADTGQAWTTGGSAGIDTNRAFANGGTGGRIDAGIADGWVEMTYVAASAYLQFRMGSTGSTRHLINMTTGILYWSPSPGTNISLGTCSQMFAAGDSIRIRFAGTSLQVWRDPGSTGAWVKVLDATSSNNLTETRCGFLTVNPGRIDNFKVYAL